MNCCIPSSISLYLLPSLLSLHPQFFYFLLIRLFLIFFLCPFFFYLLLSFFSLYPFSAPFSPLSVHFTFYLLLSFFFPSVRFALSNSFSLSLHPQLFYFLLPFLLLSISSSPLYFLSFLSPLSSPSPLSFLSSPSLFALLALLSLSLCFLSFPFFLFLSYLDLSLFSLSFLHSSASHFSLSLSSTTCLYIRYAVAILCLIIYTIYSLIIDVVFLLSFSHI